MTQSVGLRSLILVILPGLRGQNPHVAVCSCGHECADGCWHDPFVLWEYGDGLMSLGWHLHTGILLFHDSECPAEELDFGDFARAQGAEPAHGGV